DLSKDKTGVFTGAYAINPANSEKIPILIADYVLVGYGTGAIGGVPAHDERDLEFAKKFGLPIVIVVQPTGDEPAIGFTGEGIAVNSPIIDGLTSAEAKKKITAWLEERGSGKRETNTMPQWAGSCWYYLRFCDPHNDQRFVGKEAERYWMSGPKPGSVDLYVGGTEHAVLHLLYARFWHKVLFDLGYVSKPEPFQRLVNQGIILGEDNQKMSKSRGNIVNPDDVIDQHGADAFRCYEMFMGPL